MINISVIVPAYNSEATIGKCLASILRNKFDGFEIIVVDDFSTDETRRIVEGFEQEYGERIRLVKNNKNLGPSFSRQKGIEASCGSFLAFVDSDDFVEDDFLISLYDSILRNGSDIAFCDYFLADRKGKRRVRKALASFDVKTKSDQLVLPVDSFWSLLVKKELFDDITFPDIRNGEDMAVIPQLFAKAHMISYVDRPLYNYIYYPNSLSNGFSSTKIASLRESFCVVANSLKRRHPEEVEYLGVRNYVYGAMLGLFKHKVDKHVANDILDEFEKDYPNWIKNKYIHNLPYYKRFFVKAVRKRKWMLVKMLCTMHSILKK